MITSKNCSICEPYFRSLNIECPNRGASVRENDPNLKQIQTNWADACIKFTTAEKICADTAALVEVAVAREAVANAALASANDTVSAGNKRVSKTALKALRSDASVASDSLSNASSAATQARHELIYVEAELIAAIDSYLETKIVITADVIDCEASALIHNKKNKAIFSLEWKVRLLLAVIVVTAFTAVGGFFYLILRKSPEIPVLSTPRLKGEPLGLDESSAQVFCEENIRRVAKDPDAVKVPFVLNQGRGDTYEFRWNSQNSFVRMRNGLGIEVPVSASCSVNATTGAIKSLILDGKKIN